jgi:hypothetical protein
LIVYLFKNTAVMAVSSFFGAEGFRFVKLLTAFGTVIFGIGQQAPANWTDLPLPFLFFSDYDSDQDRYKSGKPDARHHGKYIRQRVDQRALILPSEKGVVAYQKDQQINKHGGYHSEFILQRADTFF